jgi:hypothetical protein
MSKSAITYNQLVQKLSEAWPGTPEYNKKFGKPGGVASSLAGGNRHEISQKDGVTKATRKYDPKTGESEGPGKDPETGSAPVKRGRGRPAGVYGAYKKKVQEAIDFLESLQTTEEVDTFFESVQDEEIMEGLADYLSEENMLLESHFKVGDSVECKESGMTGKVVKVDPEEEGKYYTVELSNGKKVKYSPDELTLNESVEQIDEL